MNDITNNQNKIIKFTTSSTHDINDKIWEATDNLCTTSKEKFNLKAKLIENADDMSTQQKLDALDQNYDRHTKETWTNVLLWLIGLGGLLYLITDNQ